MNYTRTFHENLPVEQRGHQHLSTFHNPEQTLSAEFTEFEDGERFVAMTRQAFSCNWCDAHPGFDVTGTGDELTLVAKTECPLPEGLTITFDLAVPSGRIIVADDLRPVYDAEMSGDPGYNSVAGQAAFCKAMEALGCAYGPVGNTCPSLVRTAEDRYEIVSFDSDEGQYGEETLAFICTDLWAYSIADYEHWLSLGGDANDLDGAEVADIPAGTYRFTHLTGRADFADDTRPTVYATIERLPDDLAVPSDRS